MGKQGVILKNRIDVAPESRNVVQGLSVKPHISRIGVNQPAGDP